MSRPSVTQLINRAIKKIGGNFEITILPVTAPFGPDMEEGFKEIYFQCKPYTMTSVERLYSVYKSAEYIAINKIPGDFVECGVWKGGCAMAAALTFKKFGDTQRKIYLYDTYEGMSKPTAKDVKYTGTRADKQWKESQLASGNAWCYSSLDEVKKNIALTKYPENNFIFVKGKVEDTIPKVSPENICILRLDTDWYESTKHGLVHLFPKLSQGGVLLLDDYGHWKGAKEATDEYIKEYNVPILLDRVDYTGRSGIRCV